jgi:hypothetical protein
MPKHKLLELQKIIEDRVGSLKEEVEIAEANNDFQRAKRIRKQLVRMHGIESEISSQCSYTKLRSTS